MGIEGLLTLLKPISIKQHISSLHHLTAAIDIMHWIYRACYGCTYELNQNITTFQYLQYIADMLEMLKHYSITPVCVFDGRSLQDKEWTISKRCQIKQENKRKGMECLQNGRQEEARKYLSRCINVNDSIITTIIGYLKKTGIQVFVAAYEADSQIAKLYKLKLIDFAISEDSDLVIYGVKLVTKLNVQGNCELIDLQNCKQQPSYGQYLNNFINFSSQAKIQAAILAGCDYNPSIKGIGLKKAITLISKHNSMYSAVSALRKTEPYSQRVKPNYEFDIFKSSLIFNLAITYNPLSKRLQMLDQEQYHRIVLQEMEREEIIKIVGEEYGYDQEIKIGVKNVKYMTENQIDIDIDVVNQLDLSELKKNEQQFIMDQQLASHQIVCPFNIAVEEAMKQNSFDSLSNIRISQKKQDSEMMTKMLQMLKTAIISPSDMQDEYSKDSYSSPQYSTPSKQSSNQSQSQINELLLNLNPQ